jgi:hypothetical protein
MITFAAGAAATLAKPAVDPASFGQSHCASDDRPCECAIEVSELFRAIQANPRGSISPSIYETGRLVSLAPWLPGHRARIDFVLDQQRADGGWGGVGGYGLVPTLSGTEALLACLVDKGRRRMPPDLLSRMVSAADRGLARSHRLLRTLGADDLPDTPAIEVIVPYLVALIQRERDRLNETDGVGLDRWRGTVRFPLPKGVDDAALRGVQTILSAQHTVPLKVLHSLEVAGDLALGARGVPRALSGAVGASPAATAAWLGPRPVDRTQPALRYLHAIAAQHRGPVPSVTPITSFERAWVINSLAMADIRFTAPRRLVNEMLDSVGPRGVAGGSGLPQDADTTSGMLCALGHAGVSSRLGVLRRFDASTHFHTWINERTPSPTTNAHVLAALTQIGARQSAWRRQAVQRTAMWLRDQQGADGAWSDKWHASPYYSTMCCVAALRHVPAGHAGDAVDRAVGWVLASQRRNGSWGRWTGTSEETAYALQILLYRARPDRSSVAAAARGYRFLVGASDTAFPPMWHDKDLYTPTQVVRAAVLSACHLARAAPAVQAGVRAVPGPRRSEASRRPRT